MPNMAKLLKQAAAMQKDLEKAQSELAGRTVQFSSGGGMITVTAACDGSVKGIKIDPSVIDPRDGELLEDMVLAAVDGALKAAREESAREMSKLTAGMRLPGLLG